MGFPNISISGWIASKAKLLGLRCSDNGDGTGTLVTGSGAADGGAGSGVTPTLIAGQLESNGTVKNVQLDDNGYVKVYLATKLGLEFDKVEAVSPGANITVTPTCDTLIYAANDSLTTGSIIIVNSALVAARALELRSITVKDKANAKAELWFLFFRGQPNGTVTANAAFAWGTNDQANCIGIKKVLATDYQTIASRAVASVTNVGLMLDTFATTDVYCVVIVNGTPTYAADSLTFEFGMEKR